MHLEQEIDALIAGCGKKVAATLQMLIEAGFEHICEMDGVKLFRKRK